MNPYDAPSDEVIDAREDASFGASLGIASVALCLLGQCTLSMSLFVALPLGLFAVRAASRARSRARDDELTEHLSRIGLATGASSAVFAGLVLAFVLLYVGMYVMIFGLSLLSRAGAVMEAVSQDLKDARGKAQSASILALIALILCLVGCCSYNVSVIPAIPLAIIAMHQARTASAISADDEFVHVIGRYAQGMALIALAYSALMIMVLAVVVLLYVGLFVALILAL